MFQPMYIFYITLVATDLEYVLFSGKEIIKINTNFISP